MRFADYTSWTDGTLASRLGVVRRTIRELEDERGGLVREQNRRVTEVARVKKRLDHD